MKPAQDGSSDEWHHRCLRTKVPPTTPIRVGEYIVDTVDVDTVRCSFSRRTATLSTRQKMYLNPKERRTHERPESLAFTP